jgi:hypothetical protein
MWALAMPVHGYAKTTGQEPSNAPAPAGIQSGQIDV